MLTNVDESVMMNMYGPLSTPNKAINNP